MQVCFAKILQMKFYLRIIIIYIIRCIFLQNSMNFNKQYASSSFAPYSPIKSQDFDDQSFQIQQFSRLSLNSHDRSSENRSVRSNSSLYISSIPILLQPKSSDTFSMGSRNRKSSVELQWKNSIKGNMTFLNKSFAGKSSLYHHEQLGLHEVYEPELHKELSEKSCPVGSDQTENIQILQKLSKAFEEGEVPQFFSGKQRLRRKFLKTKNLLRNLSSYLHKYIKFNTRCKKLIIKYYKKKNPNADELEAEQFYQSLVEWTTSYSLSNFQDYQKIWSQKTRFTSIYRQICYKYYRQDLFCDVQGSRLTSKQIIQQYTPQFIEGLLNPSHFTHFSNQ